MPFRVRIGIAAMAVVAALGLPVWAGPAIWHVSDADSDIYLFGTIHVLPPDLDWRTGEVMSAFQNAETVWFEAPANDPAAQIRMVTLVQQFGLNPPDQPLSSQISGAALSALNEIAAHSGLTLAGLEPFRPWLAVVTLTLSHVQAEGYDPASGVEAVLWPLANNAGKKLSYLETIEDQVRFFADLPPEIEAAYFEQTVLEFEENGDELDQLVDAWAAGDVGAIDGVMNGERTAAPEVYEVLVVDRNRSWARQIEELLKGAGTHFFALGAGHLAGPDSVIALLRSEGIGVDGP